MKRLLLLVTICHLLVGCGGAGSVQPVPDVRGQRLDIAEDDLDDRGLAYDVEGGLVVLRSHWTVIDQRPRPGVKARTVTLYVEHTEDD